MMTSIDLHDIERFPKPEESEIFDLVNSIKEGWHELDLDQFKFIEARGVVPSCVTGEELKNLELRCMEFGKVNQCLVPLIWLMGETKKLGGTVIIDTDSPHHHIFYPKMPAAVGATSVSIAWTQAVNMYNGTLRIVAELQQHCTDEYGQPLPYCDKIYSLKKSAEISGVSIEEMISSLAISQCAEGSDEDEDDDDDLRQYEDEKEEQPDEDVTSDQEEEEEVPRSSFQIRLKQIATTPANEMDFDRHDDDEKEDPVDLGTFDANDDDDEEFCTKDARKIEGYQSDDDDKPIIESW
jgi:hypothetical protein